MNIGLGLPWILILAIILMIIVLRTISRRSEKKRERRLAAILDVSRFAVQDWFTNWLANERQQDPESIYNTTSISLYEVERGLKEAKRRYEMFLLRSADIKNVGQFVDMITRQLGHEGKNKFENTGS